MKRIFIVAIASLGMAVTAQAQGLVDFDGTELNLLSYTNPVITSFTGSGLGTDAAQVSQFGTTAWGGGDSFWPMSRAWVGPNTYGMPYNISDDSIVAATGNSVYASDTLGFAGQGYENNGFFGVTDTENGQNSGPVVATFEFDITGLGPINVSIDMAAMGDFEATGTVDFFDFDYDIDGGGYSPLFTSLVDENLQQTYYMDNVANNPVILQDPLLIVGRGKLNDNFRTLWSPIVGTGSSLTIRFTGQTDGAEGFGFDNIRVVPEPATLTLLGLGGLALLRRR